MYNIHMKQCEHLTDGEHPSLETIDFVLPAAYVLRDRSLAAETWPGIADRYEAFGNQIEEHSTNAIKVCSVLDKLPFPPERIEDAIDTGVISEDEATDLYFGLSSFIGNDDYKRLVLYLPFELIPLSIWEPKSESLKEEITKFKQCYLKSWHGLLSNRDVRANFIDGDILEENYRNGDHPRVVKAAHLTPMLVATGMLEVADVINIYENAEDEVLRASLADSLLALKAMGLLDDSNLDLQSVALSRQIDNLTDTSNVTERRKAWLEQRDRERAISHAANIISDLINSDLYFESSLKKYLVSIDAPSNSDYALIDGIGLNIEQTYVTDDKDPQAGYSLFKDELLTLWDKNDPEVRKRLTKMFRRISKLGIISEDVLLDLGIIPTNLVEPLSNLEPLTSEIEHVKETVSVLETNQELRRLVYPVVIIGGSRLKGYGEPNSDLDLAIFIRPGVSEEEKFGLRAKLGSILGDEAIEFWLEEDGPELKVRDFKDGDYHRADDYWTHMLFGAAWVGTNSALNELRQRLLPKYFSESFNLIDGVSQRSLYLERLEQDLLQYRLMHKGYERHYPRLNNTLPPSPVDGQSVFWDSGYRFLATRLFINNVFLPKISS